MQAGTYFLASGRAPHCSPLHPPCRACQRGSSLVTGLLRSNFTAKKGPAGWSHPPPTRATPIKNSAPLFALSLNFHSPSQLALSCPVDSPPAKFHRINCLPLCLVQSEPTYSEQLVHYSPNSETEPRQLQLQPVTSPCASLVASRPSGIPDSRTRSPR